MAVVVVVAGCVNRFVGERVGKGTDNRASERIDEGGWFVDGAGKVGVGAAVIQQEVPKMVWQAVNG
jgi:hypothetical protein